MVSALRPLRLPGFPNLGLAYLVNELGNWLGEIALAILVFDQTGSPMATAALFCGMHFAPAVLGPPLVSRLEALPVRITLPSLYAAEAIAFAVLALMVDEFALVAVLALATLDGSIASAARALTRTAATAVLAPAGQLREGNALLNIAFTIGAAGGPAIAGLVVAGAGVETALLADAASFMPRPGGSSCPSSRSPSPPGPSACAADSPTCASAPPCDGCSPPRRWPSSSSRS
jgi:hypothetical protein